jgi:hypothetical protein
MRRYLAVQTLKYGGWLKIGSSSPTNDWLATAKFTFIIRKSTLQCLEISCMILYASLETSRLTYALDGNEQIS